MKGQKEIPNFQSKNPNGYKNVKVVCSGPGNLLPTNRQENELFVPKFVLFFLCLKFPWYLA